MHCEHLLPCPSISPRYFYFERNIIPKNYLSFCANQTRFHARKTWYKSWYLCFESIPFGMGKRSRNGECKCAIINTISMAYRCRQKFFEARYNKKLGWQWFIASEYFVHYISEFENLFLTGKIQNIAGQDLNLYSETEMSQMVEDIHARNKDENDRRMVCRLRNTEVPDVDQPKLKDAVVAATEKAEENVYNYEGQRQFTKPKRPKKKTKIGVQINSTKRTNKDTGGSWWTTTIRILMSSAAMTKVPSTVLKWALPGHPEATLTKPDAGGNTTNSGDISAKVMDAWDTYNTPGQKPAAKAKGKGKGKVTGKKQRTESFGDAPRGSGGASESSSGSSSASSSSQPGPAKKTKKKKSASVHNETAEVTSMSNALMDRLRNLETSMVTKTQVQSITAMQCAKYFKKFEQAMQALAAEMSELTSTLNSCYQTAMESAKSKEATVPVSQEEREEIKAQWFGMGFSAANLEKLCDKAIARDRLKDASSAQELRSIADTVHSSAKQMSKVYNAVDQSVKQLAQETGVEISTPTLAVKTKKRIRDAPRDDGASKRSAVEGSSDSDSDSGSGSASDADSDEVKALFNAKNAVTPQH